MEGESCYYHCVLCNYSTKAKLNLIQHVRSMKHQRSESLRKLQRLQKGLPEEDEDLGQIFTIRRCPSTDPGEWSLELGGPAPGAVAGGGCLACLSPGSRGTLVFRRERSKHSCPSVVVVVVKLKEPSTTFFSSGVTSHCPGSRTPGDVLSVLRFLWF